MKDRSVYGLLGGSFDPVQKGHVALARAALRERALKRVYLVPTGISPFKKSGSHLSVRNRLALLRAAIRGHSGLALGRWEIDRPGPSYTFQTLRHLRRLYPHRQWELIVGEDSWRAFRQWRRWREIVSQCTLVVGRRSGSKGAQGPAAVFLKTRLLAISSTAVRQAMSQGKSIRRGVPAAVAKALKNRGLSRCR